MPLCKTHLTHVPVRRSPVTEAGRKGFNHIFHQCWSVLYCSSSSKDLLGKTLFLTPEQHGWVEKYKVDAESPVSPQELFYCQKWTGAFISSCCKLSNVYSPAAAFVLSKDAAWRKPVWEGGAEEASGPFVGMGGRRPAFLLVQDPVGDNLCSHLAVEISLQGWIDRVSPQWVTLKWKLRCKH